MRRPPVGLRPVLPVPPNGGQPPHRFVRGGRDGLCAVCYPPEPPEPGPHRHNVVLAQSWRPWRGYRLHEVCVSCGLVQTMPGHWWSEKQLRKRRDRFYALKLKEDLRRIEQLGRMTAHNHPGAPPWRPSTKEKHPMRNRPETFDVPLSYDTEDTMAWSAAYHDALARDPEIVGTVEGTASWFAATMEVGRRHPKN